MKKILLLGGSAQQVVAIQKAKNLGHFTVLCDYLPDNPGQYVSDRFYLASTTEKDKILEIAKREKIDGILAYASDPAAPTAAYVAEKLGLPGNPYKSVEILCNKDKFRAFLSENCFHAPKAGGYSTKEAAMADLMEYNLPIILKPTDSSGSKGVTVLRSLENAEQAIEFAFSFSRSHRIIVEEYIEKKHPYLIGGDVFVVNGQITLWGLMNCHRDAQVNPLVPVGKSYPLKLAYKDIEIVKKTLQDIVHQLHIQNGALNVELVIDKEDNVWPIDIGPRSGGNMIPDLLGYIFNVDVVEMSIKVAMGEQLTANVFPDQIEYYATHNLHSDSNGTYEEIIFSSELEKYIIRKNLYKKKGDQVFYFDNASKALGIIFMKFNNEPQMEDILRNIHAHVQVKVS